ncbi:FtsK/SpoIIIE domain-containing protein [Pygmaiobacter massiliensis]|uniref:FtsK/SpoIIIE domain-containing protein n=1 Tax=Pygmaiobacter massiliensis TaxID=1917873 RepID=UPI0015E149C7|nr:FtsK/SpoIIIE domain-containing protein [Pygmaiobacter massiliensis]
MQSKTTKEATLLDTSILATVSGAVVGCICPACAGIGYLMASCGALGIGYYFTTWSPFDRLFKNLNLGKGSAYPIMVSKEHTEVSTVYSFSLPAGLSIDDFERNRLAIQQHVGRDIDIRYTYKQIQIEVFEQNQKSVYEYETIHCKGDVEFPVGYDCRGKAVTCDLSSGEPHMLIAGETGSGKSTVLRSIITNLILDKDVKLHLIDLKRGAEFQIFAKCRNVVDFARTKGEAERVLSAISREVDRRYDLFFSHDCVDIKEYNRKYKGLGYEVLIVDEFADLCLEKATIQSLEEISAKARACGIHIIISTQRPDAKILNGRIKANVTTVLGLKTMNETNSRIILDKGGLELLKGKGQGIFKKNSEVLVQCPYLDTERARQLLRPTYVEKVTAKPSRGVDLLC